MTDEELQSAHDDFAECGSFGGSSYLTELRERGNQRSAERQESINRQMLAITKRVEIATYVALVIAVLSLLVSLFK